MKAFRLATVCLVTFAFGAVPSAGIALNVGDAAPVFTLQASDGQTYTLTDFRGKQAVVLAWFPEYGVLSWRRSSTSSAFPHDNVTGRAAISVG
jgi:hypothetical protein